MIGARLKLARKAAGFSLRKLADRVSVSAQAIGKYERDQSMPGSGVLVELAEYLGVSIDYLLGDPAVVIADLSFRKKASTSKKTEAQVRAKVHTHVERYLFVEELLDLSTAKWLPPVGPAYSVQVLEGADEAADQLRIDWQLGVDPIQNVVELLEEHGIKVILLDLDERVSGVTASVLRPGHDPVPAILVNESMTVERQRFTLAHELGHLLLRVQEALDEEKVANRFAGTFLLPALGLLAELGEKRERISMGELSSLKALYKVSLLALVHRVGAVGIVPRRETNRWYMIASKNGWRSAPYPEPDPLPAGAQERPERFRRLVLRALDVGALGRAKAAELLETTVLGLERLLEPSGAALA